jgi:hypothetical protein
MTDAPERIWAWEYSRDSERDSAGEWYLAHIGLDGDEREYVRGDLYAAAIARAEKAEAEIDALKNPPEVYCSKCGHPKSDHPFRHTFVSSE